MPFFDRLPRAKTKPRLPEKPGRQNGASKFRLNPAPSGFRGEPDQTYCTTVARKKSRSNTLFREGPA